MSIRLPVLAAALALVIASCGSDDTTITEPARVNAGSSGSSQQDAYGAATTTESPGRSEAAPEPSAPDAEIAQNDAAQNDVAASDAADNPSGGAAPGDSTVDSAVADDGDAASPALAGPGDVPDLQMINMHTDEAISLQSVVDGQTPLLFWFWAPH